MRNPCFALFLLTIVCACSSTPSMEVDTVVEVKIGYGISYSSASGMLLKQNCRTPEEEFKVSATIPSQTLQTIADSAARAGFFSAQSPALKPPPGPEAVQITAPCTTSMLGITHRGEHNIVSWSCNSLGGNNPPNEASDAYSAVIAALQPYLSQLPSDQCTFR